MVLLEVPLSSALSAPFWRELTLTAGVAVSSTRKTKRGQLVEGKKLEFKDTFVERLALNWAPPKVLGVWDPSYNL